MFAIAGECEPEKVALHGRFFVTRQAVVGKVVQLIVTEVENRDGLPHFALLGAVSLIEHGGVPAIGT
jgi:hypothetical protein